jgi:hypothetical protein
MNAILGWGLAVIGVVLGYSMWGWRGVALAVSVIVFWLLLQFSRAMRVMKAANESPVGHVASAVMLQAKMRQGLRLTDIINLTRSLGEKRGEQTAGQAERWRWTDASGASVTVELMNGRCTAWQFERPAEPAQDAAPGAAEPGAGPSAS